MNTKELISKIGATFVLSIMVFVVLMESSNCNRLNCVDGSVCIIWTVLFFTLLFLIAVVWSIQKKEKKNEEKKN